MQALAREAPGLRCELVEAEPEQSLPALALGDVDLVLADEWQHQPHARPAGVDREDLRRDPVHLVLPADHPAARRHRHAVPLAELAGEAWTTGHRETGWEEMTEPDLPRARRLRPRHPPPDQRQRHQPGARRPRPGRRRCCPSSSAPRPTRASPCGRSPRAPCTGRSSPRPAPRTRSGPPSRRCSRPSAPPPRTSGGPSPPANLSRDAAKLSQAAAPGPNRLTASAPGRPAPRPWS